ncbi:hypothetical protein ZHAS_00018744 [Anopheles sinensis]|uniref:Uncharacterized protein n=1 Tax=Anopheles sinensis TaxID=74873 RepID=A0A084WKG0_ANOSI|nr:hypothetical protein ZHAS_00018744 [Anopheles sinensis]
MDLKIDTLIELKRVRQGKDHVFSIDWRAKTMMIQGHAGAMGECVPIEDGN